MLPPGLCTQVTKLALPRWGFSHLGRQTERERIPNPRKMSLQSWTSVTSPLANYSHC